MSSIENTVWFVTIKIGSGRNGDSMSTLIRLWDEPGVNDCVTVKGESLVLVSAGESGRLS